MPVRRQSGELARRLSRSPFFWRIGGAVPLFTKANHISELTEPVLLKGGEIKAIHQISIADSIIVAHAIIYNATLVHKDPEFEIITIVDQIKLPYKHRLEKKVN